MKIEFYPEICCEECDSVIHNHMDCPVCHKNYASTSAYGEIGDCYDVFSCEECNAKFKLGDQVGLNTWEVELIEPK